MQKIAEYHSLTFLNIHGYHGNPKNSAYTALNEIGCKNIISPSVDYDHENPYNIIDRLNILRTEHKVDLVVGTSLGGFYASVLSTQHNLPVMLVNPCLTPFSLNLLSELEKNPLIQLFGELTKIELSNVSCIVGDADELLGNHAFTEKLLGNARFRRIKDGKHSGYTLPLPEYFLEMLHYYADFLPMRNIPSDIFEED